METGIRVAGQPEGGVGGDVVGWRGGTLVGGDCPTSVPLDSPPAPPGLSHTQRRPCALPFGEPDLGSPGRRLVHPLLGRGRWVLGPFPREFGSPRGEWRRYGSKKFGAGWGGRPWGGGRWVVHTLVTPRPGHFPGRWWSRGGGVPSLTPHSAQGCQVVVFHRSGGPLTVELTWPRSGWP